MLRTLVFVLLAAPLAGCSDSDTEAPMTLDGISPEENGTLEPDDSIDAPGEFSPNAQVEPTATMEPSTTLQPDTTLTPR